MWCAWFEEEPLNYAQIALRRIHDDYSLRTTLMNNVRALLQPTFLTISFWENMIKNNPQARAAVIFHFQHPPEDRLVLSILLKKTSGSFAGVSPLHSTNDVSSCLVIPHTVFKLQPLQYCLILSCLPLRKWSFSWFVDLILYLPGYARAMFMAASYRRYIYIRNSRRVYKRGRLSTWILIPFHYFGILGSLNLFINWRIVALLATKRDAIMLSYVFAWESETMVCFFFFHQQITVANNNISSCPP